MSDKTTKTAAELLVQGVATVKAAKADIARLEGELTKKDATIADFTKQANDAASMGDTIGDLLVRAGRIKPTQKAAAIKNLSNPAKLASELKDVLELMTSSTSVGNPDPAGAQTPNTKQASEHPMQNADDSHRRRIGLA
jgi:hypothetical protein